MALAVVTHWFSTAAAALDGSAMLGWTRMATRTGGPDDDDDGDDLRVLMPLLALVIVLVVVFSE